MTDQIFTDQTSNDQPIDVYGQTAQNTIQAERNGSTTFPAQQNFSLAQMNPNSKIPPATDHGVVKPTWYSFDLTHRRIQGGGWTHQVTERELPDSTEIAGVNMRINKGGFREAHWHLADEWAIMLKGNARVTIFSPDGSMFIDDVQEGDLWIFPAGSPHSIQGTGDDGCEFLLVFNQGSFSEESTFLLSDWLMHTPPDVLEKNFGLGPDSIAKLPKGDPLYIFASEPPTQTLEQDRAEVEARAAKPTQQFTFKPRLMPPTHSNAQGSVKVVDESNFPASKKICAAIVTVKPGGLRELHWHPTGDEWQYYLEGEGRMTVFASEGKARTFDYRGGDVGYVPFAMGHYIENTGASPLRFLEVFRSGTYADLSLNQWMKLTPPELVRSHLNVEQSLLDGLSAGKMPVLPAKG